MNNQQQYICATPEESFDLGRRIGAGLTRGDVLLLFGGLGAGKTLLTKGIMSGLDYDIDEVTSPSFTLVNLYETPALDVYHIDLWRLDSTHDPGAAIGLDEILENENAVTIIEWADRLSQQAIPSGATCIYIDGDGGLPRNIRISKVSK
jgi:tRNA threonylcarbamoyladenosine biosynthesis protein TsaE